MDAFTTQYIETALWASNDELDENGGEPMDDRFEVSDEFRAQAERDCRVFQAVAGEMLDEHDDCTMAAHDFWLTRNGHGAGFWDGDWPVNGELLTNICKAFGESNLYIGDDQKVYSFQG